jgi:hypothetical protein
MFYTSQYVPLWGIQIVPTPTPLRPPVPQLQPKNKNILAPPTDQTIIAIDIIYAPKFIPPRPLSVQKIWSENILCRGPSPTDFLIQSTAQQVRRRGVS